MLLIEGDVDAIIASFGRQIRDGTRAITVISAINGSFARTFDGDAETTLAGAACVDHELGWFVHYTVRETGTGGPYLAWIGAVDAGESVGLI